MLTTFGELFTFSRGCQGEWTKKLYTKLIILLINNNNNVLLKFKHFGFEKEKMQKRISPVFGDERKHWMFLLAFISQPKLLASHYSSYRVDYFQKGTSLKTIHTLKTCVS